MTKEQKKEYDKIYKNIPKNKLRQKELNQLYYLKNKIRLSEYKKQWKLKNQDKVKASRERNKKNANIFRRVKKEIRKKNDPSFVIELTLRNRIYAALNARGKKKAAKSTELLGCTISEFKKHLENLFAPGMSWNNKKEWHLDHIQPCASFDLSKKEEQLKCFHYTNYQPLWSIENYKKGSWYNGIKYNSSRKLN